MHNKKTIIITSVILCLVVLGLATSYALFTFNITKDTTFRLGVGNLELSISDNETEDVFIMDKVYPIKDEVGLSQDGYTFTVTNTGSLKGDYSVYLDDVVLIDETHEILNKNLVKFNLVNNETGMSVTDFLTNFSDNVIDSGVLEPDESVTYTLKMWVDYNAGNEAQNKYFAARVRIDGTQHLNRSSKKLSEAILNNNTLITSAPTLTTSSNETSDPSGLYSSTATNSGEPTYYFRGNVNNNYVSFAGLTWRIVRINEDGTVRLILQDGINNNANYTFNTAYNDYKYMYYTNSDTIKPTVDSWYTSALASYSDKIATGNYFCEQAKVKYGSGYTSGNATMVVNTNYTPDFKCSTDGNGKGLVNSSIGLITYDEMVYAGGYCAKPNSAYYLNNDTYYWSMSPAGAVNGKAIAWYLTNSGSLYDYYVYLDYAVRPVINLKSNVAVTGTGTSTDPYVVSDNLLASSCEYEPGQTWDFDYTGGEQEFEVPCDGTYKLETWGAQGGKSLQNNVVIDSGGYGGYSYGNMNAFENQQLYINVGGEGSAGIIGVEISNGGYNGGGNGLWDTNDDESTGGGGGATHIAMNSGLLSTLSGNKNSILIVSGAGGGGSWNYMGGSAGGFKGNMGMENNDSSIGHFSTPGTQTSGYYFGLGGNGELNLGTPGGGGGAGYFGGYGGINMAHDAIPGAGGSSYIGNALLTNKSMYCYNCTESDEESTKTISTTCHSNEPTENCAKEGNGYARITLESLN